MFQARQEGLRHHQHEDNLRFVQQAVDDISWTIDQAESDDLLVIWVRSSSIRPSLSLKTSDIDDLGRITHFAR